MSNLKVGSRLASAILMYSFGARGGEERGVFEQEIVGDSVAIDKPELISFNRHIPADELDLSGYLLAPRIVEQFQQPCPEPENDETQLIVSSRSNR